MSRKCPQCGTSYPDSQFFCGEDGAIIIQELPSSESDRRLGERMGDYIVVARVADGAMGRVYEGRHVDSKARVAIKVLHDQVARDPVAVERFRREAETARELAHQHVVHIVDFGQTRDLSSFMTMEFLEGEELGQLLRREGAIHRARVVRILSQMSHAIDHAHGFGVVHRDLKPDNIFLVRSPDGDHVRILDFGSVKLQVETGPKLTAFGTTLGSPYYMSPEQAMGRADVDHRTDVFACTAILYEMLTGKIAFEASNLPQILMRIMNDQPAPPSSLVLGLPVAVDDVVEKGLRKDKSKRYASVSELGNAFIASVGLAGTVSEWAYKPLAEITSAVSRAEPPQPKPFGAPSLPPPADRGSRPSPTANTDPAGLVVKDAQPKAIDESSELPVVGKSRRGLALAVIGVIVVIALATIALTR